MVDTITRVLVVAGVAVAAVGLAWWTRRSTGRPADFAGLPPGVYLFTSATCSTCADARRRLVSKSVRFTELSWEQDQEVLTRAGIEAVPSVGLVGSDGIGRLWKRSAPVRVLRREGP